MSSMQFMHVSNRDVALDAVTQASPFVYRHTGPTHYLHYLPDHPEVSSSVVFKCPYQILAPHKDREQPFHSLLSSFRPIHGSTPLSKERSLETRKFSEKLVKPARAIWSVQICFRHIDCHAWYGTRYYISAALLKQLLAWISSTRVGAGRIKGPLFDFTVVQEQACNYPEKLTLHHFTHFRPPYSYEGTPFRMCDSEKRNCGGVYSSCLTHCCRWARGWVYYSCLIHCCQNPCIQAKDN